jgi:hypothetical protein
MAGRKIIAVAWGSAIARPLLGTAARYYAARDPARLPARSSRPTGTGLPRGPPGPTTTG